MILASDLTKRYEDGLLALDAISLKVNSGELYCLLGANGAGKTTAINLFMGFIQPTSGSVIINGTDVVKNPMEAKRFVSYVSDDVQLYGNFTARQNVEFFTRLGGRRELTRDYIYSILREVGLPESSFEQKMKHFSQGMRQKVGIAIAIMRETPAILLDEPTFGLDPQASAEVMDIVDGLRTRGKAILMATQDIFRVKEIADRIGILKKGRKVLERTRDELEYEDLQALYLDYMRGGFRASRDARVGSWS
jgi:ABC-2 type transport system ATP-binding protein